MEDRQRIAFADFSPALSSCWDELVEQSDDGWLYGMSRWLRMTVTVPLWNFQDKSFAVMLDGKMAVVVPLQLMSDGRLVSTVMGASGPVIARGLDASTRKVLLEAAYGQIKRVAANCDAMSIEVALNPLCASSLNASPKANPILEFGFEDISTQTWLVDLAPSIEDLFRRLSENARREIKEARRLGYKIRLIKSRDEMDVYYQVHSETYQRTGVHPHPKEYFLGIYDEFTKNGFSKILVAENASGEVAGFFNVALYKKKALYWTSCCRNEDYRNGVYYLLMWSAIEAAKSDGCDYFECGEAFPEATTGSKERGLSDFKKKFGGHLHPFFKGKITLRVVRLPLAKRIHSFLGVAKRGVTALMGKRASDAIGRGVWVVARRFIGKDGK